MTTRTSHVPRAARVHNTASGITCTDHCDPSAAFVFGHLVNRSCVVLIYGGGVVHAWVGQILLKCNGN